MGAIGFVRAPPGGQSGKFGFVGFIGAPPLSRWVHSDPFGHTLCVIVFNRVLWINSRWPLALSGSLGLAGLFRARRGGLRWVHSGA